MVRRSTNNIDNQCTNNTILTKKNLPCYIGHLSEKIMHITVFCSYSLYVAKSSFNRNKVQIFYTILYLLTVIFSQSKLCNTSQIPHWITLTWQCELKKRCKSAINI